MQIMRDAENDSSCAKQMVDIFNKWQHNGIQAPLHNAHQSFNTTSPSSIRMIHKPASFFKNSSQTPIFNKHQSTNKNLHNSISLSSKLSAKTTSLLGKYNAKSTSPHLHSINEASQGTFKKYKCQLCSISSFPSKKSLHARTKSTKHWMVC